MNATTKITYVSNSKELEFYAAKGFNEFIVGCVELSRFDTHSTEELIELMNYNSKRKLKLTLEWDALYQEKRFKKAVEVFEKLPLSLISSIRLQDPGAIYYVKEKFPWLKVQLILETGNHNLIGLKRWQQYLGDQLERLVLSNELSKEHLEQYAREMSVPLEVLIFGRILLFYSPRGLLNPLINKKNDDQDFFTAKGTSEESPHAGFPLIENTHGTFMFNVKDLSLLGHIEELQSIGILHHRFDFRFDSMNENVDLILEKAQNPESNVVIVGPRPFIKGFYNINKTDVLFAKLKNNRVARNDESYLGEVLDVEKSIQLSVCIKKDIDGLKGLAVKMITPEGKIKKTILAKVHNSLNEEVFHAKNSDIVLIQYISGVTAKSQLYIDS